MSLDVLEAERRHLANLLEAIQRSVFFLHETESKLDWPLDGARLAGRKKDIAERFNAVHDLTAMLWAVARRLVDTCRHALHIEPASADFSTEFVSITAQWESRAG
jgi:hypothetical protein